MRRLPARALVLGGARSGKSALVQLCCGSATSGAGPVRVLVDPLHRAWELELTFVEVPVDRSLADVLRGRHTAGTPNSRSLASCVLLVVDRSSSASYEAAQDRASWAEEVGIGITCVLSGLLGDAEPDHAGEGVPLALLEGLAEKLSAVQPACFDLSPGPTRMMRLELFLDVLAIRLYGAASQAAGSRVASPRGGALSPRAATLGSPRAAAPGPPRCASVWPARYMPPPRERPKSATAAASERNMNKMRIVGSTCTPQRAAPRGNTFHQQPVRPSTSAGVAAAVAPRLHTPQRPRHTPAREVTPVREIPLPLEERAFAANHTNGTNWGALREPVAVPSSSSTVPFERHVLPGSHQAANAIGRGGGGGGRAAREPPESGDRLLFEVDLDLGGGREVAIQVYQRSDLVALVSSLARKHGLSRSEADRVALYLQRLRDEVVPG